MTDFTCSGADGTVLSCHSHSAASLEELHCAAAAGGGGGDSDHGHSHGGGGEAGGHGHSHSFCGALEGAYTLGIHVAAVFIVLAASAAGAALPLVGRRCRALRVPPYAYALGKACAVGVMIAVALIHMVFESSEALAAECIPASFAERYEAWTLLLALLAAVLMHFVDTVVLFVVETLVARSAAAAGATEECGGCAEAAEARQRAAAKDPAAAAAVAEHGCLAGAEPCFECEEEERARRGGGSGSEAEGCGAAAGARQQHEHPHGHDHEHEAHGHSHGVLVAPGAGQSRVQYVVAALCMEFGVTLHSVFVGLAIGIAGDAELTPLLVALVFHQLFEGLAMGARLAEAEFMLWLEVLLAVVFSLAAPVGVAAGTGSVWRNREAFAGAGYALTTGVLDAVCGGILLYLGFSLMFVDFPADVRRYCGPGQRLRVLKLAGLFAALWVGAAVMAIIGKWV